MPHVPLSLTRVLQTNKVVVVLNGRYAGRKAVIVKSFDEGTTSRPYGHALVVGIDNYPRKARPVLMHACVFHEHINCDVWAYLAISTSHDGCPKRKAGMYIFARRLIIVP